MTEAVYAAGAVCWRNVDGVTRILVIHRPRYGDVTLPKGKVDVGETLPQAAVREVAEETGLTLALGTPLGQTHYRIGSGREKLVHYWAAEVTDRALDKSVFRPNDEVSHFEWVTLDEARSALSYPHDLDIVDEFVRLHGELAHPTFALIVLRHAKALARSEWSGADWKRPLAARGQFQARSIVPTVRAWSPKRIITSNAVRCVSTVKPLARALGRRPKLVEELSQDAWDEGKSAAADIVAKRLERRKTAVLCSHRPVLPDLLLELALATNTTMGDYIRDAAALEPAAFSIAHLRVEDPFTGILAIETHRALI
ncbi:NUDIX domain-containing protein [Gryllotalpicola sp.]|uniref:NUDIX hydrolase n=1 Tax=Gryllotalpicola sp. TaxID=1932787 RepID=UPI002631BBB4|nr:NUDIX domain-containing protein [Gryllotalpicola sp.]